MKIPGAGHGQPNGRLDANQKMLNFFEQYLKNFIEPPVWVDSN